MPDGCGLWLYGRDVGGSGFVLLIFCYLLPAKRYSALAVNQARDSLALLQTVQRIVGKCLGRHHQVNDLDHQGRLRGVMFRPRSPNQTLG